jgi:hypothetical protein
MLTDWDLGSTTAQNLSQPHCIYPHTVAQVQPQYPVINSFKLNQLEFFILVMCLDQSSSQ